MCKKRVVVAMSGGVDSTVAAFLLVRQGYDVIGMTAKLLPDSCSNDKGRCCSDESTHTARRACDYLGIPHHTSNLVNEFRQEVVKRFVNGYQNGITPNPCLDCNRFIKFDLFFKFAKTVEAEMLATGHYARIKDGLLLRGIDTSKDQSYFLAVISRDRMNQILFPLGVYNKTQVREIAKKEGFASAERPDSQDICFTSKRPDFNNLCANFDIGEYSPKKGLIIDETGLARGGHTGIECFTLGQRRGMKVGMVEPRYVYNIDSKRNEIHVAPRNFKPVFKVILKNCNWIASDLISEERKFEWKLRYRSKPVLASIRFNISTLQDQGNPLNNAILTFDEPQYYVTPGQWAVAYDRETVVGCGEIESPL